MSKATLYNQDFLLWTQQQAECLKKGRWALKLNLLMLRKTLAVKESQHK